MVNSLRILVDFLNIHKQVVTLLDRHTSGISNGVKGGGPLCIAIHLSIEKEEIWI